VLARAHHSRSWRAPRETRRGRTFSLVFNELNGSNGVATRPGTALALMHIERMLTRLSDQRTDEVLTLTEN